MSEVAAPPELPGCLVGLREGLGEAACALGEGDAESPSYAAGLMAEALEGAEQGRSGWAGGGGGRRVCGGGGCARARAGGAG